MYYQFSWSQFSPQNVVVRVNNIIFVFKEQNENSWRIIYVYELNKSFKNLHCYLVIHMYVTV